MLGSFMNRISRRKQSWALFASLGLAAAGVACVSVWAADDPAKVDVKKNRAYPQWEIHDMKRPKPPVVTPGTFSTQDQPGQPPSDAIVLFDGKDPSKWNGVGGEGGWKVENGYMEIAGKGGAQTKDGFGDCQLHIEWATPTPPKGTSQARGNSGVFLMGIYELQVLDSFENETYADGQASASYGQNPPLVNASRPPGQWQTYDVIWRGPRFDKDGKVTRPATLTVLHNGVLTQDRWALTGPNGHHAQPLYRKHPEKLPLSLQNHNDPVRFRNIWIRELKDAEGQEQHAETGAGTKAAAK